MSSPSCRVFGWPRPEKMTVARGLPAGLSLGTSLWKRIVVQSASRRGNTICRKSRSSLFAFTGVKGRRSRVADCGLFWPAICETNGAYAILCRRRLSAERFGTTARPTGGRTCRPSRCSKGAGAPSTLAARRGEGFEGRKVCPA